jgi:hypothetical protein
MNPFLWFLKYLHPVSDFDSDPDPKSRVTDPDPAKNFGSSQSGSGSTTLTVNTSEQYIFFKNVLQKLKFKIVFLLL